MGAIISSVLLNIATIIVTLIVSGFTYYKWKFTYWRRRNVPFVEPSIPFGNIENPITRKQYLGLRVKSHYDEFKAQGYKHGGVYMFASPNYIPVDPEYVKNIMSKDFRYFTDRGMYCNVKDDPLSAHLFNLPGQRWKNLRTKLNPTFTPGKIKLMFPTMIKCSQQLNEAIDEFRKKNLPIDAKEIAGSFTTDVIGGCVLGLECNSFLNPDGEFRKYGRRIFTSISQARTIDQIITFASQDLARFLHISVTPPDVSEFFTNIVRKTVEHRKTDKIIRKDLMQILIDLRNAADKPENSLTIEEMAAHVFIFFLAGFETSSTTLSFCLFELSRYPEIQSKVREEVFQVLEKHGGELTYEAIMDLKYMNQVIEETLREYPPTPLIPRTCVEDYKMPGTDVTIEKGTLILIPVHALHNDPEYYPNPDVFDPERFSEENKSKRIPFTYIPFGEGPRICIGLRFGWAQIKVGLAMLLTNFEFSLNKKTKIPLELDPMNLMLTSRHGIWLDIRKLSDQERHVGNPECN